MTFAKRTAFGVIVGIVTWWIAFWASLAIFVSAWPALYEATRPALARGDVSRFTTPMWLLFLSMYLWVNPVAGWVTVTVAQRRHAVGVVAGIMGLYAAWMHYYRLWSIYPDWFNVLVPISIPLLMYLGARWSRAGHKCQP